MTKCENCYHAEICKKYPNTGLPPKMRDERLGEGCEHFKDKSLIVELPCKAGDTIYEIIPPKGKQPYFITAVVCAVHIADGTRNHCNHKRTSYIVAECPNTKYVKKYVLSKFGKTVFTTREEAERALNEREERV